MAPGDDRMGRVVLGLAVFGLSFFEPAGSPLLFPEKNGLALGWHAALAAACAVTAVLVRRVWWPLCLAAGVAWLVYGIWPGVVVASYYAATWPRPRLVAYAVATTAAVLVPGAMGALGHSTAAELLFVAAVAMALVWFPLVAGLWVTARRQARQRAEAARVESARVEERTRIAREMHDVVAHRVSLMVLHAGALELRARDEQTASEAALIRTTGRQALTDLRHVLGSLRPNRARLDPQPTLADLDRLLDQSRAAGVPVERRDEGVARPLPTVVQQAAYRVVQEALTNVHKHAAGAGAEVVLRYSPDDVEVVIGNTAPDTRDAMPGSGLGLVGLRERVEVLGGSFEAGHRDDGGFTVRARLPAEEVA